MKNDFFKFIFILSFIPYLSIFSFIFFGEYYVDDVELHGIQRLLQSLVSFFEYYIYAKPIVPTCLTFQMCYIFRNNSKTMFICSFIPYLFALLIPIYSAFSGIGFIGETFYGYDGFRLGFIMIFLSYIISFPIIPICLIFQIRYIIKNSKKNNV